MRAVRCVRLVVLAAATVAAPYAGAWDIDYALGLGVAHSDNIGRRAIDEVPGNIFTPYVDVAATQDGDELRANIVGTIGYDYFTGDAGDEFDNNFSTRLGADVTWQIRPERFLWSLDDYASQQPVDPYATINPGNIQNTNVFSTGPSFLYRFSEAMAGRTELRYVNSYAEENDDYNSNRVGIASRILRSVSPLSTISGNVTIEGVWLDDPTPVSPDFNRYALFGGYDWRSSRTTLRADVGWNWVDYDGLDSSDSPLVRLIATVELSPITIIDISGEYQLSDAATEFATVVPDVNSLLVPDAVASIEGTTTITSDVYENKEFNAGLTRRGERFLVRLGGHLSDQDYEFNPALNQRNYGVSATFDYSISSRTSVGVYGVTDTQDFEDALVDARETAYGLRMTYTATRNIELNLEGGHAERTDDLNPLNEFDESRIYGSIVWRDD